VSHTGATDSLNKCLLDNAVLNVEGKLACALLRCAPTNTVSETGDVTDLLCLNPKSLLGNGSGTVVRTLGNYAHVLYFMGVDKFCHNFYSPFFDKLN
jgi:hypothetical protein